MTTSHTTSLDLTTEAGVEAYVANTPYACTKVETVTGGTGNFVFRIHLREPYEGQTTLIIKHSEPYVKNMKSLAFDVRRQFFEVKALKMVGEWCPPTTFVTVPRVYHHDEAEHTVIMEDCGSTSVTLKQYMQQGRCSVETAHQIGKGVGEFLGRLHAWGRGNKKVCEFFEGNQEAKQLSSWVFYGRLLPTFDDEGLDKLRDPDVELSSEERNALEKIAEEAGDAVRRATGSFVMGDFWPGNLVLSFGEGGEVTQIRVVDWELAKPGVLGVELGQFCAELVLLMRFNAKVCGDTARFLLEDFLGAYTQHIEPDLETCRRTIVHLGTHLVTLTPRVEWGGKEKTQDVVKEGLSLILDGYSAERGWLEKSVIKSLVTSAKW